MPGSASCHSAASMSTCPRLSKCAQPKAQHSGALLEDIKRMCVEAEEFQTERFSAARFKKRLEIYGGRLEQLLGSHRGRCEQCDLTPLPTFRSSNATCWECNKSLLLVLTTMPSPILFCRQFPQYDQLVSNLYTEQDGKVGAVLLRGGTLLACLSWGVWHNLQWAAACQC